MMVRWLDQHHSDFFTKDDQTMRQDDEKRPQNPPEDAPKSDKPSGAPPVKPQGEVDNPAKNPPPPPPPGQGG